MNSLVHHCPLEFSESFCLSVPFGTFPLLHLLLRVGAWESSKNGLGPIWKKYQRPLMCKLVHFFIIWFWVPSLVRLYMQSQTTWNVIVGFYRLFLPFCFNILVSDIPVQRRQFRIFQPIFPSGWIRLVRLDASLVCVFSMLFTSCAFVEFVYKFNFFQCAFINKYEIFFVNINGNVLVFI